MYTKQSVWTAHHVWTWSSLTSVNEKHVHWMIRVELSYSTRLSGVNVIVTWVVHLLKRLSCSITSRGGFFINQSLKTFIIKTASPDIASSTPSIRLGNTHSVLPPSPQSQTRRFPPQGTHRLRNKAPPPPPPKKHTHMYRGAVQLPSTYIEFALKQADEAKDSEPAIFM